MQLSASFSSYKIYNTKSHISKFACTCKQWFCLYSLVVATIEAELPILCNTGFDSFFPLQKLFSVTGRGFSGIQLFSNFAQKIRLCGVFLGNLVIFVSNSSAALLYTWAKVFPPPIYHVFLSFILFLATFWQWFFCWFQTFY